MKRSIKKMLALAICLCIIATSLIVPVSTSAVNPQYPVDALFYDITYKSASGQDIKLDILTPTVAVYDYAPVMVLIHGGGWSSGDKSEWYYGAMDMINSLRAQGIMVININYRLATTLIKSPAAIVDCKDAIRWIRKNYLILGADYLKIGVWGVSAGGHLALMDAVTADNQFQGDNGLKNYSSYVKCCVSWCGPTDLVSIYSDPDAQPVVQNFIGGPLWLLRSNYEQASPIEYLSAISSPTLLVYADQDYIVPISQASSYYAEAVSVGANCQLTVVQNADHGFVPVGSDPINPSADQIKQQTLNYIVTNLTN